MLKFLIRKKCQQSVIDTLDVGSNAFSLIPSMATSFLDLLQGEISPSLFSKIETAHCMIKYVV